jgi:hypothetical protein
MEKLNLEVDSQLPVNNPVKKALPLFPILIGVAIVLGVTSGVLLAQSKLSSGGTQQTITDTSAIPDDQSAIKVGTVYGSSDESAFKDKAEGVLQVGGVGGEGTHHVVRVGGASQNVYLSSSVVDLDLVDGARVQVWGQTMNAKKAGWLMDVGRLKVLELNAPLPE